MSGNNFFKFKKFIIFQDKCAMKVGTDGVLLGCWANNLTKKNILDVGTGTGLIALIVSQRYPYSKVSAIEIDKNSFSQAKENIENSKFSKQIEVFNISLQNFANEIDRKYDLILSNPPYFNKSLKSFDENKNIARHTEYLSYDDLLKSSSKLLSKNGAICIILPSAEEQNILNLAKINGLFLNHKVYVQTTPNKSHKRILFKFSLKKTKEIISTLIIENSRHNYSDEFNELIKDFYLDK